MIIPFIDSISQVFAVPRAEALPTLERIAMDFFPHEPRVLTILDKRWRTNPSKGCVEVLHGGRGDEFPDHIEWTPWPGDAFDHLLRVTAMNCDHSDFQTVIERENRLGLKVQPFRWGFRIPGPMVLADVETLLNGMGWAGNVLQMVEMTAVHALFYELSTDRPFGNRRDPRLPAELLEEIRALVWSGKVFEHLKGVSLDRPDICRRLAAVIRCASRSYQTSADELADAFLDITPQFYEWKGYHGCHVVTPHESGIIGVDFVFPYSIYDQLPCVPLNRSVGGMEVTFGPESFSAPPVEVGVYEFQCRIFDTLDRLREAAGLSPDIDFDMYRNAALRK